MPRFVMIDIKTGHITGAADANSPLEAVVGLAPSGDYQMVGGNVPTDAELHDGYRVHTASPDFVLTNTEDPHVREVIAQLPLVATILRNPPPAEVPAEAADEREAPPV